MFQPERDFQWKNGLVYETGDSSFLKYIGKLTVDLDESTYESPCIDSFCWP